MRKFRSDGSRGSRRRSQPVLNLRRMKQAVAPLARALGVPTTRLCRELRLHPRQPTAGARKVLALAHCVMLLSTRTTWRRYAGLLKASLSTHFGTASGAGRFARALAAALPPAHVVRCDAKYVRALLAVAAETVGGPEWARRWMHRRCAELAHRTPWAVTKDLEGFKQALKPLLAEGRRRQRAQRLAARSGARFRDSVIPNKRELST